LFLRSRGIGDVLITRVGLMVLFSETLNVLLPWRSSNEWKIVGLLV
jgi:hypothetical protein